jgi:hypothetical protein
LFSITWWLRFLEKRFVFKCSQLSAISYQPSALLLGHLSTPAADCVLPRALTVASFLIPSSVDPLFSIKSMASFFKMPSASAFSSQYQLDTWAFLLRADG